MQGRSDFRPSVESTLMQLAFSGAISTIAYDLCHPFRLGTIKDNHVTKATALTIRQDRLAAGRTGLAVGNGVFYKDLCGALLGSNSRDHCLTSHYSFSW